MLAIEGGTPVRQTDYPTWPQFGVEEEEALIRSLRQGQWWRVHGSENTLFEAEFAAHHGAPYAVAVANGTVAIELALQALGIGPGDEVIVPAFTFISTSMACQRIGATAVPVDVLPTSLCIDPSAVERALSARTRAIIPVHMSGHLCDMDALCQLAERHGLHIIQDAAHAHGARGRDRKAIGEWGTLACFSFQNFKLMTAGEGGLVLCPTEALRDRVYLHANCGRPPGDRSYRHTVVGTNARLNEFSAAVLRSQLQRLDAQTARRERNAAVLAGALAKVRGVTPQARLPDATVHPHYMYVFCLDDVAGRPAVDRARFVDCLIAEGIPAFRAYEALYNIPSFWLDPAPRGTASDLAAMCPNSERVARTGVWIHHRALLGSETDTLDIATAIEKVLAACDQRETAK